MTLRFPGGQPYRSVGSIQQFDPENPEHNLFHAWDQEIIQMGGSPIFYYEVFIPPATIDPIYWESRSKLYSNFPVQLWGFYDPQPAENTQNQFGIDSATELVFEFNVRAVLEKVGHLPKVGSRLFTPHKREHWRILQRNMGEFKMWGELRIQLIAERFQETVTEHSGTVTNPTPDFVIN